MTALILTCHQIHQETIFFIGIYISTYTRVGTAFWKMWYTQNLSQLSDNVIHLLFKWILNLPFDTFFLDSTPYRAHASKTWILGKWILENPHYHFLNEPWNYMKLCQNHSYYIKNQVMKDVYLAYWNLPWSTVSLI